MSSPRWLFSSNDEWSFAGIAPGHTEWVAVFDGHVWHDPKNGKPHIITGLDRCIITVSHQNAPRFTGELMVDDYHDPNGITLDAGHGLTLCRIQWVDKPLFDAGALCRSLRAAIDHHDAISSGGKM